MTPSVYQANASLMCFVTKRNKAQIFKKFPHLHHRKSQ